MTIKETRFFFTSKGEEAIQLEGALHRPGGKDLPAAIVCHPHSLYGGSMDVSVVVSIARTLAQCDIMAFRFNFRGVGRSEGAFGDGVAELDDVAGAVDLLLRAKGVDQGKLYLVGYSFGAWVGLHHAEHDPRICGVVAIGLPVWQSEEGFLSSYARPKLFIAGEDDSVCPPDVLHRFVEGLPPPKEMRILRGTDHFLIGREKEVAEAVADFIGPEKLTRKR
ncbi:MAG: alpha/beta family hydrolase [Anaerolineae bacterium]